ncbi:Alpha/Beta hydrolase protein [Gilbertella persicaria]|uniref:Alpha/Beta hydrolase protein n=1 Tax=Gilbertella persicaria TaxID=101096 RepID=UPI00222078B0|nr:Alpha/Beta hydrolase protein [Gilbertella persicaria]KAI8080791.1 Alpha/Beta hydrolase protein [Gilbertella persicaria]
MVPKGFKKITRVAGKQIEYMSDTTSYLFSMSSRSLVSVSSSKEETIPHPSKDSSAMANALLWTNLIPPMPIIASTMYRHYAKGPPAKSWTLATDVTIAIIRDFLQRSSRLTVEDLQKISTTKKLPVPQHLKRIKFTVPNSYRQRAGEMMTKQLSKMDQHYIAWNWEKDKDTAPPLKGEWLQAKGNPLEPSKESTILYLHGGAYYLACYGIYRQFLSKIIKYSKGRTCAIDYRLAPQHPFPAAVEDALATYLYLIDPPKDSEVEQPVDPKKIVVAGDSAGGGLTFALLMAIRDAGLPAPAGAMTLSPWMDLTHSLPSILSNIMTDYLPPIGFKHAPSVALDYAQLPAREKDVELLEKLAKEAETSDNKEEAQRQSIGPFGECVPLNGSDIHRVQFYASNEALKVPMVSPIFDRKQLRGLPRLLVQCGTAERLRDESIYSALQASNTFPGSTNTKNEHDNTQVTLEMFTDQPHVFQLLFSNKSTTQALKNLGAFVRDVTNSPVPFEYKRGNNPTSYLIDDSLTVKRISPAGHVSDTKTELLKQLTKETWQDWENRLARPSLKQRMDEVALAYEECTKKALSSIP